MLNNKALKLFIYVLILVFLVACQSHGLDITEKPLQIGDEGKMSYSNNEVELIVESVSIIEPNSIPQKDVLNSVKITNNLKIVKITTKYKNKNKKSPISINNIVGINYITSGDTVPTMKDYFTETVSMSEPKLIFFGNEATDILNVKKSNVMYKKYNSVLKTLLEPDEQFTNSLYYYVNGLEIYLYIVDQDKIVKKISLKVIK